MKTPFLSHVLVLLIAAALAPVAVFAAESPSLLLQKGIYAEEVERNLDSAIKIYEQIGAEAAASRSVAAQAQYRLAVCYQKLGKKEQAIKILNELVQQNQSDAAISAKARKILAELGATPSMAVSVRRIPLTGTPAWFVAISPDGRFVAYENWEGDELYVQELATGKTQLIDKEADITAHSPPARFSPDGQWIAYDIREAAIKIARTDGTEIRKLYQGPEKNAKDGKPGSWIAAGGWSTDGSQVIMALWDNDRGQRIAVALDAKTGAAKEIAPAPLNKAGAQWIISENGQYLARHLDGYPKTIALFDFKSGSDEVVVEYGADRVMGWYANDTKLIYSRSGTRGVDLWMVGIAGGKPVGEPELVWSNIGETLTRGAKGFDPLGVTRDGRVFFAVRQDKPAAQELWVMEGVLSGKAHAASTWTEIPPSENVIGPDRTINDRKFGLTAAWPEGWGIKRASRIVENGVERRMIELTRGASSNGTIYINYAPRGEREFQLIAERTPPSPVQLAFHQNYYFKNLAVTQGLGSSAAAMRAADYKFRPASIVARMVGRTAVITGIADFTKDSIAMVSGFSTHLSPATSILVTLRAPADALAEFQRLVDSIKIEDPLTARPRVDPTNTMLKLETIVGPGRSVRDPTTGLALVLPGAWEPLDAFTTTERRRDLAAWKFSFAFVVSAPTASHGRINYFTADDQPTAASGGVDRWLREWPEFRLAKGREMTITPPSLASTNHVIRADSLVFHDVKGHRAVSWIDDHVRVGEKWSTLGTLIHGAEGNTLIRLWVPIANVDNVKPDYDRLLASLRLP